MRWALRRPVRRQNLGHMGFQLSQRGPGSARWRKQPNPERAAKARNLFGN
jgi:hypothetical protein